MRAMVDAAFGCSRVAVRNTVTTTAIKNACGYSLAANIPDHYGHAISIEREEVKEIASDLTSWPNFGADLKVGLGQVHRRLLRRG